jgi:hypothetical protein
VAARAAEAGRWRDNQIGDAAALSEALKYNASLEQVAPALLCAGGPVSPRASPTLLFSLQAVH